MKRTRIISLILSLIFIAALFTGCGNSGSTATPPPAAPEQTPDTQQPAAPAQTPEAQQSEGSGPSALELLLAKEDKLPLGGIQPAFLESRAHINKALPFKAKNDPVTIAWASATQGATFFTEMVRTAQETADKYGYTLHVQNANFDINAQMTQIENFLIQDVDFLVVNAVDIDATVRYYEQAVEQGTPVIAIGPTGGKADYPLVTTLVASSFTGGYYVGLYAAEKLYDTYKDTAIKVGSVIARAGDGDSNSQICGFISGYLYKYAELAGKPYETMWDATLDGYNAWIECRDRGSSMAGDNVMDLVGYVAANASDSPSAQAAAADLLTAHADMDILWVDDGTMEDGVLMEITLHGMTPGEDILVCLGGEGEDYQMQAIKEGKVFAAATNPPEYTGAGVVDLIHKIVAENYDANNLPATLYTPTYVIHAENVDEYLKPGLLFSPALPWEIQNIDEYNAANAE